MKTYDNTYIVEVDGNIITAYRGVVSTDKPEYLKLIKRNQILQNEVVVNSYTGLTVNADPDWENNPEGFLASLISPNPGRSIIIEAPEEIIDVWFPEPGDNDLGPYPKEEAEFTKQPVEILSGDTIEQAAEEGGDIIV